MRKRQELEDDSSEMEVDDEERKMEMGEYDDEDDGDDEEEDDEEMRDVKGADEDEEEEIGDKSSPVVDNTFMDSFYGLSDANPRERAQAAQAMLNHCLLGPSANSKDAAYAFRRLLNGLCSGRAAARQGNASALASFLKIAFQLEKMEEIQSEAEKNSDDSPSPLLTYVRDRLISATDPNRTDGKKKGSEERDYHFGRLFGILGFVRSGILLLTGDDKEIKEVAASLVLDLVELFWRKRWMREPAAHGITAMLNLFFGSTTKSNKKIGQHLVKEVVVPKVLIISQDDRSEESDFEALLQKYTPEQVGIGAYIQARSQLSNLPFPLDQPIVSTTTLPLIGQALSETSVIVQPRTHFVWDTIWSYLTETAENSSLSKKKTKGSVSASKYILRDTIPHGEDKVISVIESIMKVVVEEKLLHIEKGASMSKTTHERRSLALCIVRNLSGASYVSSMSGPTQIMVDSDAIESVILTPDIIRSLFLVVICSGKNKQDTSHLLKPLALEVLGSMVESAVESGDSRRQLAFLKAISNCDPRFDSRTKTNTISGLLSSSNESLELWGEYLAHLETRFLELCCKKEDSSAEANGCVELLYGCAKHIVHLSNEGEKEGEADFVQSKQNSVKRVLGFFMSTAFFDCSNVNKPAKSKKGKKTSNVAIESALKVQASLGDGQQIPHSIRSIVGARFFALVSEFALTASRESSDEGNVKVERDFSVLGALEELFGNWKELESQNAKRFVSQKDNDGDDEDGENPEDVIKTLLSDVYDRRKKAEDDKDDILKQSEKRCVTGMTVLAMTLQLHRLSCGADDDEMDEDPDADEEEDEENICNAIEELKAVSSDFMEGDEAESNPLLGLAEVCANILSSPLGSGDIGRGAAPRLVREAIRCAWLGGLSLASATATDDKTLLDSAVVGLLMDAVGASNNEDVPDDEAEADADGDDDDDDSDESDSDGDSDDDMVFSKASKVFNDPESMENDDSATSDKEGDESDIELDPSKLHTMLEDDNLDDVDDIVLEHHEGADAALAKLIKLKQDARKAGQEAREKIELSNEFRCTFLIDLLLSNPDLWSNLFQSNTMIEMVVPLLDRRKSIGKSTQKAIDSGGKSASERKKVLNRLTGLITQRLCKVRPSSMPLSSPIDTEAATKIIQHIMKEAKHSKEKEYLTCCSSSLIFVFRLMPNTPELISLASTEYGNVVREWSTKRNSGASLVEDLIVHMPALAQASILGALTQATQDARVPILKMEAYRLLSQLFSKKPDAEGASEMEKIALSKVNESQDDLLRTIKSTLIDEEMMTSKRARGVFVAFEKMLPFLSSPASQKALDLMASIKSEINRLGDKHSGLNAIATKTAKQIDEKLETLKVVPATPMGSKTNTAVSSSKKKSKKKKKKR